MLMKQVQDPHNFFPVKLWCLHSDSRSKCPRGLRFGSVAARLLGLRVRLPPGARMSISSELQNKKQQNKGKAIILQAWTCPESYRSLSLPDFKTHEGGKIVSPRHRPPLPTRKYSWYSFLLEADSTPGQHCGRKDYVNDKFQWHHRELKPRSDGL